MPPQPRRCHLAVGPAPPRRPSSGSMQALLPAPCRRHSRLHAGAAPGRVDTQNAQTADLASTRQGNRPKTAKCRPRRHVECAEWRFGVNAATTPSRRNNAFPSQPDAAVSPPPPGSAIGRPRKHRRPPKRHRPLSSTTAPQFSPRTGLNPGPGPGRVDT